MAARKTAQASFIADIAGVSETKADTIAVNLAFGALLRHYSFKKYLTKKTPEEGSANGSNGTPPKDGLERLVIHCADPDKARAAFEAKRALANGIYFARDLVNEPANVLGPVEFADRVKELERVGLEVEILDVEALTALKMNTLLSVAQGSVRPARVAVMQWHGAKSKRAKPLAFIGKGVVFDTGGLSMKPAAGMEDMKGDMGGAACVTGLMYALAERKAPVNAVGIIGIVENMPSGSAITAGRHRHLDVGPDGRELEHRRRGPARPGRRALVRAGAFQAALRHRSRDADGRHHGGARQGVSPVSSPTTRSSPSRSWPHRRRRARRSGACRSTRPTTRCSTARTPT